MIQGVLQSHQNLPKLGQANCIRHRWTESLLIRSIVSPIDPLEGAHVHAINTRTSLLPRGAGSGAIYITTD